MNVLIRGSLILLLVGPGYAESTSTSLPSNVVKVTKKNNPKCVEYITYKNQMYCSLVALGKTTVDPEILTYETQNIQFDNRAWKAAWGQKNNAALTVEYIPVGGTIDNWSELITSQYLPGMADVSAKEFKKRFIANLEKSGITYSTNIIDEQPNQIIFEFKVTVPTNLQQDEIQKIIKSKDGIYVLHYAMKKADMGKENRQKWIEKLKKSTVKQ
ncbi:hypothetical protein [uncultured Legionella sp.]|uniref:hypothetical protein n=1 Tax=uncultured Legionella sp. TaxID=210934 RepID=UPI00262DECFD|nr:hypothetical protein [uncultured Legionella sp.]